MGRLYHATTEFALPNILAKGLCTPHSHGNFTGTIGWEKSLRGPDPRTSLYFVRDQTDAENLSFTFSQGGIPTLLAVDEEDAILYGSKLIERGNETILINASCIPPSDIHVYQYMSNRKWRKLR